MVQGRTRIILSTQLQPIKRKHLEMAYLSAVDYIVLVIFLLLSAFIGVYHAVRGGHQRTAKEYLLADRRMHPVPVTISVIVSVLSAVTFLGTTADTYIHGPQYWVVFPCKIFPIMFLVFSFVPIFYKLKVTSIFEYLGMRFGRAVQLFGMSLNCLYLVLYLGVVVYGPALALNAVTGMSITGSILAAGVVCTFYTTIGGIKAVLWADVFQSIIFLMGFLVTIVATCVHVGGLGEVFRINARDGRGTFFDFRLDPTIRHSFWTVFIGFGTLFTSYTGTNQIIVQRYMTCRSLKQSQLVAGFSCFFLGVCEVIAVLTGFCMYAYFAGCDPYTLGEVEKPDQLMAYIIMELFEHIPGMAGFLISAVFSASLSTASSGVNALTTMVGQDLIKIKYPNLTDIKFTAILKLVSVVFGVIIVALAFLASSLGGLLQIVLSLVGILNGPILGVFCLGIYVPFSNSKGAIAGMTNALAVGVWLKIGALIFPPTSYTPPLYIDQCPVDISNLTDIGTTVVYGVIHTGGTVEEDVESGSIYALSYAYYTLLTSLITIIVGILISVVTGPNDPTGMTSDLFSPIGYAFCCCLPKRYREKTLCGVKYRPTQDKEINGDVEQPEVIKTSEIAI